MKYKEVYLYAYDSVAETRQRLDRYFRFYNNRRPHSSLTEKTPEKSILNHCHNCWQHN
ncbi:MAG: transposase [Gammaproteobacteria bacterium]|nr:transposase [Gammaproteobacteria bacterium]